jgi:ribosomal-protein-alanine N-acetyltransferase
VRRELRTERLLLRPPVITDADEAHSSWMSDPEVTRWLTWRPHASVDQTRAFLELCAASWERGNGHLAWMIELDGHLAGSIGITPEAQPAHHGRFDPHRVTIGYGLGRAFWNRGIATEATRAVIAAVLEDMPSVFRVWSVCDVENLASARVLEKAGMTFEGILRRWVMHPNRSPEPRDCRCYALSRS